MILQQLREKTAEHHKNLETSALLSHFSHGNITLPIYEKILSKFYGYFSPLESQFQQIPLLPYYLSDYSSRRKTSTLQKDLSFLNSSNQQGGSLEICRDIPTVTTLDKAFGCLYVMEGSTLGAKVISKVIQEKLGISENNGGSYFQGYGPATGEYWRRFCAVMEHYAETEGNAEEIVESANQVFIKLKAWLDLSE